ncbi:MAG: ISL3 family transposase [Thermostichus sp. BF3_bins_97]
MVPLDKLLGLSGVQIQEFVELEDHVVLKLALTSKEMICPHCGQTMAKVHQNRPILVRDLSLFGRSVYLQVPRRQFYCSHCQHYSTEVLSFVDWERSYTKRYETYIYRQVKQSTIEQVSQNEGLSRDQVEGIFKRQFEQQQAQKKAPGFRAKKISIDEISLRKGRNQYVTVISDLENHCLLEVIDVHKAEGLIERLESLWTEEERLRVEEVSIDMWAGFTKVVRRVFPKARIVYDRFHVMQKAIQELDRIRRQAQITEKGSKRIILKNNKDLTEEEKAKLEIYLKRSKRLRQAYELKERLRSIFESIITVKEGESQLVAWLAEAQRVYTDVVKTVRNHLQGICHYFVNRVTNGMMEGINNRIKVIKRQGYGFTNMTHFRARLLAAFWT